MKRSLTIVFMLLFFFSSSEAQEQATPSLKHPVIDSRMTKRDAFDGLDPNCPKEIRKRQKLVKVKYYSFDRQVHQGQLVIDKELVRDV